MECFHQVLPLSYRPGMLHRVLPVHPRIDLVVNPIEVGRADQQAGHPFQPRFRARSRRNDAASITSPTAWNVPRSASLVGTAGFTSTQTVGVVAGRRLPVAIECSVVATRSARPTFGSAARMAFCASTVSVMTPGSGPSSRIDPAITTF